MHDVVLAGLTAGLSEGVAEAEPALPGTGVAETEPALLVPGTGDEDFES